MPPTITPEAFIAKWEAVTLNEKATAQEHFIDLCRLLGLPTPNEADPKGQFFRFEKPLTKAGGSAGFADVWYRDRFAWEYKTKGKYPDLRAAYQQLLLYKEDLDNPPILVACDIASYEVHVAFTGYRTLVERFTNADLANAKYRTLLRQVFTDPEQLRPRERAETITERAAGRFAEMAQFLERRGFTPAQIAPFFMRVLFALFAEDIKILFLYVALNQLKDLEKEIWQYAGGLGLAQPELGVSPAQLYGIEKNPFAAELAQVVV